MLGKIKPHSFIVVAKFTGKHGSMGYRKGHLYRLRVEQNSIGHGLHVLPLNSHLWGAQACPYANMQNFLQNWQITKTEGKSNGTL